MDHKEDFFLSEEVAEWIGLKKSEYLSKLIMQMIAGDFGFEEFHLYDYLIPQTIGEPDRAYEDKSDSYPLRTCVRTYAQKITFHHVVIGALIHDGATKTDVLIPVLSFVTKKEEVVREWTAGESLPRPTLN